MNQKFGANSIDDVIVATMIDYYTSMFLQKVFRHGNYWGIFKVAVRTREWFNLWKYFVYILLVSAQISRTTGFEANITLRTHFDKSGVPQSQDCENIFFTALR